VATPETLYYSAAWRQFLIARSRILARYDAALQHAKQQPVQTHHGVVGEAAIRNWLTEFLPKRFGVTSGYIRSQGPPSLVSHHFDVIVYDALEAPILWTESNDDKATAGSARIIPAEYVSAVLEVKAAFNRTSVADALAKLDELHPFMAALDIPGERFPKFLPRGTALALLFIELREVDEQDASALELLRVDFPRPFLGAVVLRGAAGMPDATAVAGPTIVGGDTPQPDPSMWLDHGLRSHIGISAAVEQHGERRAAMIKWDDSNFADFAFQLLEIMRGNYDGRRSFHAFDLRSPKTGAADAHAKVDTK